MKTLKKNSKKIVFLWYLFHENLGISSYKNKNWNGNLQSFGNGFCKVCKTSNSELPFYSRLTRKRIILNIRRKNIIYFFSLKTWHPNWGLDQMTNVWIETWWTNKSRPSLKVNANFCFIFYHLQKEIWRWILMISSQCKRSKFCSKCFSKKEETVEESYLDSFSSF